MNRLEFMNELRNLLWDISWEEREEALQYYNSYFDDAGEEKEADIIAELGSPQKVAEQIKAGLGGSNEAGSEYSEKGYTDTRFEDYRMPAGRSGYRSTGKTESMAGQEKKPWSSRILKLILILLIIVIGCPIIIPVALAGVAVILAVLTVAAAVIFTCMLGGVAVAAAGLVTVIAGISQIFHSASLAFGMAGAGLLMIAAGAVGTAFVWWLGIKIIPPVFRWFVELCRKPFQKRRED